MRAAWSTLSPSSRRSGDCASDPQRVRNPGSGLARHGAVLLAGVVAVFSAFMWVALPGAAFGQSVPAAHLSPHAVVTAPSITQCDAPDFPGGGTGSSGEEVTCSVEVVNNISSLGATSSTVTTSECMAAAGVPLPSCPLIGTDGGPTTSVTTSSQLVTSVNQCNDIVTGHGNNVICDVTVTNNVPVGTTTSGVTVDQCNGSATGGGSIAACDPSGSTTSATVTQCNGSATGGGTYDGENAVGCTVTGAASALPVTVNQCNGTANGGGSAVTCATTMTDNFITPTATTSTTIAATTPTTTPPVAAVTPTTVPAAAAATTATTAPAGASPAAGTPGSTVPATVIPTGAPSTGEGGAAHGDNGTYLVLGGIALAGAGGALVQAIRRRRVLPISHGPDEDE
jgi:hypothetical protein